LVMSHLVSLKTHRRQLEPHFYSLDAFLSPSHFKTKRDKELVGDHPICNPIKLLCDLQFSSVIANNVIMADNVISEI